MSHLVKSLAYAGIVSSVCSHNSFDSALCKLKDLDLAQWFVFPSVGWEPKAAQISRILQRCILRPHNTLFVDDEARHRNEAQLHLPGLLAVHPDDLEQFNVSCLPRSDPSLSKLQQYAHLQKQVEERERAHQTQQSVTSGINIQFLSGLQIALDVFPVTPDRKVRVHELIQKTNQLNFTKNRISLLALQTLLRMPEVHSGCVGVRDRLGDYGITGFFAVSQNQLMHYLFSCRIMNMGIEQYVYKVLGYPLLNTAGEVASSLTFPDPASVHWLTVRSELESIIPSSLPELEVSYNSLLTTPEPGPRKLHPEDAAVLEARSVFVAAVIQEELGNAVGVTVSQDTDFLSIGMDSPHAALVSQRVLVEGDLSIPSVLFLESYNLKSLFQRPSAQSLRRAESGMDDLPPWPESLPVLVTALPLSATQVSMFLHHCTLAYADRASLNSGPRNVTFGEDFIGLLQSDLRPDGLSSTSPEKKLRTLLTFAAAEVLDRHEILRHCFYLDDSGSCDSKPLARVKSSALTRVAGSFLCVDECLLSSLVHVEVFSVPESNGVTGEGYNPTYSSALPGSARTNSALKLELQPFDLEVGPLVRVAMICSHQELLGNTNHYRLCIVLHHLLSDASSCPILARFERSMHSYLIRVRGPLHVNEATVSSTLPTSIPQYREFVSWEHCVKQSSRGAGALNFWVKTLETAPHSLPIAVAGVSVEQSVEFAGRRLRFDIDSQSSAKLASFCQRYHCTPFMTFYGLFGVHLCRSLDICDTVIGIPFANRNWPQQKTMIGPLVQAWPLRFSLSFSSRFSEVLADVRRTVLASFSHSDGASDSTILQELRRLDRKRQRLFEIMFNWLSTSPPAYLTDVGFPTRFLMELSVFALPSQSLACYLTYDSRVLSFARSQRLLHGIGALLTLSWSTAMMAASRSYRKFSPSAINPCWALMNVLPGSTN